VIRFLFNGRAQALRYPDVRGMLTRLSRPLGRVCWSRRDLAGFQTWLERLTGDHAAGPAVTLRLGDSVQAQCAIGERATGERATGDHPVSGDRFICADSLCLGAGGRYRVRREFLLTAVRLRPAELLHFGPRLPLIARGENAVGGQGATYVFQSLIGDEDKRLMSRRFQTQQPMPQTRIPSTQHPEIIPTTQPNKEPT